MHIENYYIIIKIVISIVNISAVRVNVELKFK